MREAAPDLDAERAICGILLLDQTLALEVAEVVSPQDFSDPACAAWLGAMLDLVADGQRLSALSVATRTRDNGHDAYASTEGIGACLEGTDPADLPFLLKRMARVQRQRRVYETARAIDEAANLDDPEQAAQRILALADSLAGGPSERGLFVMPGDNDERLREMFARQMSGNGVTGLSTGWPALDVGIDGIQPGILTVFYAVSGHFKSIVTLNICWELAKQGVPGLWYPTELPTVQVDQRLVALETGYNLRNLRFTGRLRDHADELDAARARIRELPRYMVERTTVTIPEMRRHVARWKRTHDIQYVLVDLMDHIKMGDSRMTEVQDQSSVVASLKDIGKAYDVAMIATTHVKKPFENGQSGPLSDHIAQEQTKGSSSKYQDADNTISLVPVKPSGGYARRVIWWEGMTSKEFSEAKMGQAFGGRRIVPMMAMLTKAREGENIRMPFVIDIDHGMRLVPWEQAWDEGLLDGLGSEDT